MPTAAGAPSTGQHSGGAAHVRGRGRRCKAVAALARRLHVGRRWFQRHVVACHTHNWSADPFSRGAYSYVVGGGSASAMLARPVAGTLFFAGEAYDAQGRNRTVEGAIASGRRAARQVMRALD